MVYQGKGLDVDGLGIIKPIKVEEMCHREGLGYVRMEVGE